MLRWRVLSSVSSARKSAAEESVVLTAFVEGSICIGKRVKTSGDSMVDGLLGTFVWSWWS